MGLYLPASEWSKLVARNDDGFIHLSWCPKAENSNNKGLEA